MDILAPASSWRDPAPGFNDVFFPGEPEHRLGAQRRREGIPYAEAKADVC